RSKVQSLKSRVRKQKRGSVRGKGLDKSGCRCPNGSTKQPPSLVAERMILRPLMEKDAPTVQRLARSRKIADANHWAPRRRGAARSAAGEWAKLSPGCSRARVGSWGRDYRLTFEAKRRLSAKMAH